MSPDEKAVDKRAREEAFHADHPDWTPEQWAERTRKYEERQEKIRESKLRRQEKRDEEIEGRRPAGGYVEKNPAGPIPDHIREMRREARQRAEDGNTNVTPPEGDPKPYQPSRLNNGGVRRMTPPEDDGLFEPENLPTLSQNKIYGVPSEYAID